MKNWYWIELIGFDVNSADYGVGDFLARTGGRVEGVSFLFSNIDFINTHEGVTGKYLTPCECSYGAHPYNEERARQEWKDTDLKGLIAQLHSRGVKVVFSCFNIFTYGLDGKMQTGAFCSHHREIWDRNKNGDLVYGVNVLKHLKNGTLYEDYLFSQMNRVIADYGFDGIHVADGVSTARQSVQNGDFSDDIVGQFAETGNYPFVKTAESKALYRSRRKYILENCYEEFVTFLADRWAAYYDKLFATVKGLIIFNNCWTLDPFEALYRYGFDYTKVGAGRAYGVMIEEISATRPILSKEDNAGYESTPQDSAGYHYKYMLMQMSNRMAMPQVRLLPLTPIKDDAEQWDILRHNPMELQRDLARRCNLFAYTGKLRRCMDEPFFCTSDAVPKTDWDWLFSIYDKCGGVTPESVCGYTALYSQERLYRELHEYVRTKNYTSQELHFELLQNGLDIGSMAQAKDAAALRSPLLLVHYGMLSEEERTAVEKSAAPLVILGEAEIGGIKLDAGIPLTLRNMRPYEGMEEDLASARAAFSVRRARRRDKMGGLWTSPLPYNRYPAKYFEQLAVILSKLAGLPLPKAGVHVAKLKLGEGEYRYLVSNNRHCYALPRIVHGKKIGAAVSLLKYKGYPVYVDGDAFIDRVPPRGMSVVDIREEEGK